MIRENTRAILAAASARGKGWRQWRTPGVTNAARLAVGRHSFYGWTRGAFWFSEQITKNDKVEEVRRGFDIGRFRQRVKAEARALIFLVSK